MTAEDEIQQLREQVARLEREVADLRDVLRRHAIGILRALEKTSAQTLPSIVNSINS